MLTFAEFKFDDRLNKGLDACGYKIPTPIQSSAIPIVLSGKDLAASAQTGTGKTAAFVLPALQRLSLSKSKFKPRVLILSPTRELATQIFEEIKKYSRFLPTKVSSVLGGVSYRQQLKDFSNPLDIIVATPGRLLDLMNGKKVDLSEVELLVLDEADRMLDMGFIDDVKLIAKKRLISVKPYYLALR